MGEITNRPLTSNDLEMLQKALDQDEFRHAEVKNYTMDNAYSEVYEDENGPIGVLRYTKALKLMCVWCDNKDKKRNAAGAIKAVQDAVAKAKAHGFTMLICETENPALKSFYVNHLGFIEAGNTLVKGV